MSVVIVLDMDPRWWVSGDRFEKVIESVGLLIGSVGLSLAFPANMETAIVCAFPSRAEFVVTAHWRQTGNLHQLVKEAIERQTVSGSEAFESPIAQAISRGLCFIRARPGTSPGHIIVFDCSRESTELSSQSVALSNCGWTALGSEDNQIARISVVSLGSSKPSTALLGLVSRTGGVHIPHRFCESKGTLLQALLFHLCVPADSTLKIRPPESSQEMSAVCVCHNKSLDKGYVCSICLSIYCSDGGAICSVCGSRIRREAKDEVPIHSQVFSRLFGGNKETGFPASQNIFS
jgi:transcription initiation factor TFIIH subunit 3